MSPLSLLSSLLRGRSRPDPSQLQGYGEAVAPLVARLGAIYERWRQNLELDSGADELANAASIQRWEAAALIDLLGRVQPPAPLAKLHADLQALTTDTARAAQLLSNGYRFHSSNARCDGQALMLASEGRFQALCRSLVEQGISAGAGRDDGAAGAG